MRNFFLLFSLLHLLLQYGEVSPLKDHSKEIIALELNLSSSHLTRGNSLEFGLDSSFSFLDLDQSLLFKNRLFFIKNIFYKRLFVRAKKLSSSTSSGLSPPRFVI